MANIPIPCSVWSMSGKLASILSFIVDFQGTGGCCRGCLLLGVPFFGLHHRPEPHARWWTDTDTPKWFGPKDHMMGSDSLLVCACPHGLVHLQNGQSGPPSGGCPDRCHQCRSIFKDRASNLPRESVTARTGSRTVFTHHSEGNAPCHAGFDQFRRLK